MSSKYGRFYTGEEDKLQKKGWGIVIALCLFAIAAIILFLRLGDVERNPYPVALRPPGTRCPNWPNGKRCVWRPAERPLQQIRFTIMIQRRLANNKAVKARDKQ